MTHITKEGLLQALNEYEFERPSSRKWILARAAELSAHSTNCLSLQSEDNPPLPCDCGAGPSTQESKPVDSERVAQLIAHRACCGSEHDPANGKLHGCCVVCGVPWPCSYASAAPSVSAQDASPKDVKPDTIHEWDSRSALFGKCERCGCSAISLEANGPCKGAPHARK